MSVQNAGIKSDLKEDLIFLLRLLKDRNLCLFLEVLFLRTLSGIKWLHWPGVLKIIVWQENFQTNSEPEQ